MLNYTNKVELGCPWGQRTAALISLGIACGLPPGAKNSWPELTSQVPLAPRGKEDRARIRELLTYSQLA